MAQRSHNLIIASRAIVRRVKRIALLKLKESFKAIHSDAKIDTDASEWDRQRTLKRYLHKLQKIF